MPTALSQRRRLMHANLEHSEGSLFLQIYSIKPSRLKISRPGSSISYSLTIFVYIKVQTEGSHAVLCRSSSRNQQGFKGQSPP
ncbi:unnamed protein product [Lactuca virosa]|uniref:Uncharacterized protein n=1 Tax=Lactuca virosa TaxID=75947 RepID=A0AAU9PHT9_9ASTR|nr:unnamed protein product [Lactuca virosa]